MYEYDVVSIVDATKTTTTMATPEAPQKDDVRGRREWNHLTEYEQALYLDAVEIAIERGYHQRFVAFHADKNSHVQGHESCAFFSVA